METSSTSSPSADIDTASEEWLRIVRSHVRALKYGAVQIIVHDRRVVQVECTERIRLERGRPEVTGTISVIRSG